MTIIELGEAYLRIGLAVALVEAVFFFPWKSVMTEVEKHLGHLGMPVFALAGAAVVGVVYAMACTVAMWPMSVYDMCKKKSGGKT